MEDVDDIDREWLTDDQDWPMLYDDARLAAALAAGGFEGSANEMRDAFLSAFLDALPGMMSTLCSSESNSPSEPEELLSSRREPMLTSDSVVVHLDIDKSGIGEDPEEIGEG